MAINDNIEIGNGEEESKDDPRLSHVVIILDRSGSMSTIRSETIGAFNEQVATIKKESKKIDTRISLVTFSTVVDEPVHFDKSVRNLKKLKEEDYKPDGYTSLYDAMGTTLTKLKSLPYADKETTSFLVLVISDGQENNSKEYNSKMVADLITPLQDTGRWTFTYLGANQDLGKIQKDFSIPKGNIMSFAATGSGVHVASASLSRGMSCYYNSFASGNSFSTGNFFGDDAVEESEPPQPDLSRGFNAQWVIPSDQVKASWDIADKADSMMDIPNEDDKKWGK